MATGSGTDILDPATTQIPSVRSAYRDGHWSDQQVAALEHSLAIYPRGQ
ncbi:hypothetical protein [Natronolimnobius sp. AArcel1]|nr:hypothetical protein [Natronolimnobius sp. AArcel1]